MPAKIYRKKAGNTLEELISIPTYLTGGSQTTSSSADGGDNVYTFTKSDGTTSTLTVKNGSKGSKGDQGIQGVKGDTGSKGDKGDKGDTGDKGSDGVSCTHSWSGTTLSVTSASGTTSADLKGEKGDKGDKGDTGEKGSTVYEHNLSIYYSTNLVIRARLLASSATAITNLSTLASALNSCGYKTKTTALPCSGRYYSSSYQADILGMRYYSSSSVYLLIAKSVTYSSSTATMLAACPTQNGDEVAMTSCTVNDYVRTL